MSDLRWRFSWRAYGMALLLPAAGLALFNIGEIVTWLQTGMCPGGPMDRPAAPCGPLRFLWIVVLGGWAAFLVVPLLLACWVAITIGFVLNGIRRAPAARTRNGGRASVPR